MKKTLVRLLGTASIAQLFSSCVAPTATPQAPASIFAKDHIVYFIGAPSEPDLNPKVVEHDLGSSYTYHEASGWNDVVDHHQRMPINILIIDQGSITSLDYEWIKESYWTRWMGLIGIRVSLPLLEDIIYRATISHGELDSPPPFGGEEFFSSSSVYFSGSPEYMAEVRRNPIEASRGNTGHPGASGQSKGMLSVTRDGVEAFYGVIELMLEDINGSQPESDWANQEDLLFTPHPNTLP